LSPRAATPALVSRPADIKYLRSITVSEINMIDQRLAKGQITIQQAYDQLKEASLASMEGVTNR
jgi:hypothetical protein